MTTVLVTGGSGFLAGHAILQLLAAGYNVRTTLRNLSRAPVVRQVLAQHGAQHLPRLEFAAADLLRDEGWAAACAGCQFVLHVASPFPASAPKNEAELIVPARDGTLRVLRAAHEAGVERVVLTSSFAAIGYGHAPAALGGPTQFDESYWTNAEAPEVQPYIRSKTLAERAAWDFAKEHAEFQLAVVNPVGIFGPVLSADYAASIELITAMLQGKVPAVPRLSFGVVDVRDVVDLHLRAMTSPVAAGERFLCNAGEFLSVLDIAGILRDRLGATARRVPRHELPDWLVRLSASIVPVLRQAVPELGRPKQASSAKARSLLGWAPRSSADALVATAESLIGLGLVKGLPPARLS